MDTLDQNLLGLLRVNSRKSVAETRIHLKTVKAL